MVQESIKDHPKTVKIAIHEEFMRRHQRYRESQSRQNSDIEDRSDILIAHTCTERELNIPTIIDGFLQAIREWIGKFHRMSASNTVDPQLIFNISSTCNTLGTSDMFHDLLEHI